MKYCNCARKTTLHKKDNFARKLAVPGENKITVKEGLKESYTVEDDKAKYCKKEYYKEEDYKEVGDKEEYFKMYIILQRRRQQRRRLQVRLQGRE